jgi:histidinol-phosphate aminotransferase
MNMTKLKSLVTPEIEGLVPYPPGKPIEELEREYGIQDSIKLASNENAVGPSPKALEAIRGALNGLHRYPDGSGYYLKASLANYYDIKSENIIIGNGSNEIIELIFRTFLLPGDEIIVAKPTFVVYELVAQASRGKRVVVPLKEMRYDLELMADKITHKTKLIFIANPNNPTGTIVKKKEFEKFLTSVPDDVIVVLDEAYGEYVTDKEFPSGLEYWNSGKMLVVLRTFSKIYGLAGLRIGYGIARSLLVDNMNKVRQPFNVNSLAQIGARAALGDKEHMRRSKENNRKGLDFLFKELHGMGYFCVPTQANFFLIKVGNYAAEIYERLLRKGIIVRPMKGYNLDEYIRVTVGLPEENQRFIAAFKEVVDKLK